MDDKKGTGTGDKLKILKKYISEKNIIQGLRYIILALLVFLCGVIAVASFERGAGLPVILTLASAAALVFSMVMKIFVMRTFLRKIAWYVIDSLLLLVFTVFSSWGISLVFGSSYIYLVYMLVLSEYYLSAPSLRDCAIMFAVNLAAYTVVYIINAVVRNEFGSAFLISSQYFLVLIVLVLHFIMFNFAMTVSRKNKQIEDNLRELEDFCDTVGLLHRGGVLLEKEIDELKLGLHRVQVVFREPMTDEALHGLFNVVSVSRTGSLCTMVVRGDRARIEKKIASLEPQFCEFLSLSLEEVFIREMEAVGYDFEQIVC